MSTFVAVNTYTHSVTFVTNKILLTLQSIIQLSGLNPEKLLDDWVVLERGIRIWLGTQDLRELVLEIYNPTTNALIGRWDLEIRYGSVGDGDFWVNTDDIRYHIYKSGVLSSTCKYRILANNNPFRPDVDGWEKGTFRSTEGFAKQSIGTTVDGNGLAVGTGYWRKA